MGILLAIVAGTLLALAFPNLVLVARPALQPAFAVTMLLVGTLVERDQVRAFVREPTRPLLGLVAQYTIMPLTAAAIAVGFDDPVLRTGIVLVGCMPGAMASNVMTVLFRGDLILSVTMTTVASLMCPVVIGFWLPLLADARIDVPVLPLMWNATWMVVAPVCVGITIRYFRDAVAPWWNRFAGGTAAAAIVLIVLVVVAANRDHLTGIGGGLAASMLLLNIIGYGLAYAVGRLLQWPAAQLRTLVIEVGMQNAGLGSVLALAHLGDAGAAPSAFYTALCVVTAAAALPFARRFGSAEPES
jgi:BASS family bile acid:Na+ symporter